MPLAIRYNPFVGTGILVGALFILGTTLIVGVSVNTITGLILLAASIGFLTQPAILVTDTAFEHRNMLGMTMKTNPFSSLRDVVVEDGQVFVVKGGTPEKVIGARFHLRGDDLAELERRVTAARA